MVRPSGPEVSSSSGSPADSPARIKRLTPKAIRTNIVNSTPVAPLRTNPAMKMRVSARNKLAKRIIRCRDIRSRIVPTSGPIKEYGSNTTANAIAADLASGCRSGENNMNEARAD